MLPKFYKTSILLILTICSVSSYGQQYKLDTIFKAEDVDYLSSSKYKNWSMEKLATNFQFKKSIRIL
ncbi:MAG: hypothetical protein IKQ46_11880 [Bacteroidales bacterium]|nr:hypothetical protein [Bacteroidales bacterium]